MHEVSNTITSYVMRDASPTETLYGLKIKFQTESFPTYIPGVWGRKAISYFGISGASQIGWMAGSLYGDFFLFTYT